MQPWERQDTVEYIAFQIFLVDELLRYKKLTLKFCDDNNIENPSTVIACLLMSAAWVYAQYGEKFTVGLSDDYLDLKGEKKKSTERPADLPITIHKKFIKCSHTDLMTIVSEACAS